eukprot:2014910-Prymnesium_polylepis.1
MPYLSHTSPECPKHATVTRACPCAARLTVCRATGRAARSEPACMETARLGARRGAGRGQAGRLALSPFD